MMDYLVPQLDEIGWRGWQFLWVTTIGGHDPTEVAANWTVCQVFDAYYDLQLKRLLEY